MCKLLTGWGMKLKGYMKGRDALAEKDLTSTPRESGLFVESIRDPPIVCLVPPTPNDQNQKVFKQVSALAPPKLMNGKRALFALVHEPKSEVVNPCATQALSILCSDNAICHRSENNK